MVNILVNLRTLSLSHEIFENKSLQSLKLPKLTELAVFGQTPRLNCTTLSSLSENCPKLNVIRGAEAIGLDHTPKMKMYAKRRIGAATIQKTTPFGNGFGYDTDSDDGW
jgi:hypothetical protein